jgi:hypothetical protein
MGIKAKAINKSAKTGADILVFIKLLGILFVLTPRLFMPSPKKIIKFGNSKR